MIRSTWIADGGGAGSSQARTCVCFHASSRPVRSLEEELSRRRRYLACHSVSLCIGSGKWARIGGRAGGVGGGRWGGWKWCAGTLEKAQIMSGQRMSAIMRPAKTRRIRPDRCCRRLLRGVRSAFVVSLRDGNSESSWSMDHDAGRKDFHRIIRACHIGGSRCLDGSSRRGTRAVVGDLTGPHFRAGTHVLYDVLLLITCVNGTTAERRSRMALPNGTAELAP